MRGISLLLNDALHVVRVYVHPINSHALQVYHSVLATGPHCKLLDHLRRGRGRTATPRLISDRALDWTRLEVVKEHTSPVNSVDFFLDGTLVISIGQDNTVRMWHTVTGKTSAVLVGHRGPVLSVALSADGKFIASGSADKTLRVWDALTSRQLAVLEGHSDWVWSVAFSHDGAHVVSGSDDMTVRLWDMWNGKQVAVQDGHSGLVRSVAFLPDGKQIISEDHRGRHLAWDISGLFLPSQFGDFLTYSQICNFSYRKRGHSLALLRPNFNTLRLSRGTKKLAGSLGSARTAAPLCDSAGYQMSIVEHISRAAAPQLLSEHDRTWSSSWISPTSLQRLKLTTGSRILSTSLMQLWMYGRAKTLEACEVSIICA
jgi:hypothetical protein